MTWQVDTNGQWFQTSDGKPPAAAGTPVTLPNGGTGTYSSNQVWKS